MNTIIPNVYADSPTFERMLLETFRKENKEDLPFTTDEIDRVVFDIFKNSEDFSFGNKEDRLSNLLILTACLYSAKRKEKICFISPTSYYALQAKYFAQKIMKGIEAPEEANFYIGVPGMETFEKRVNESQVLFMHGKDFSAHLPNDWKGRKIIHIFPDEHVPVDPTPISRWTCYGY